MKKPADTIAAAEDVSISDTEDTQPASRHGRWLIPVIRQTFCFGDCFSELVSGRELRGARL